MDGNKIINEILFILIKKEDSNLNFVWKIVVLKRKTKRYIYKC